MPRERLGEVAALQRLVQYLVHANGGRTVRERNAPMAAHENDGDFGSNPPDFARQLDAHEIRHRFIGEHQVEALRLGPKGLQRRLA